MDFTPGEDVIGLEGVAFAAISFQQLGGDTLMSVDNDLIAHFKNTSVTSLNDISNFAGLTSI